MKKIIIAIAILMYLTIACQKPSAPYQPQTLTVFDLDRLSPTIESEKVPLKVIYDRKWFENDPGEREKYIEMIRVLAEGPDSSIYILDARRDRLVQLSQEGTFLRTVITSGEEPGHLYITSLVGAIHTYNHHLYIADKFGMRLQVFDYFGHLQAMPNVYIEGYQFAVGKNGTLLYYPSLGPACPPPRKSTDPPPPIDPQLLYLAVMADTSGREIKKIGPIRSDDSTVYFQDRRHRYAIIASDQSPYIWFVFQHAPCIRRYDYQGRFLEEIRFESQQIAEAKEKFSYSFKPNFMKYILILTNAHMVENGDLILSVLSIGDIRLSVRGRSTALVKKYELLPLDQTDATLCHHLKLRYLHGKKYAYFDASRGVLLKESL